MADAPAPTNGTPPAVTDHRPVPRPAIPRSMQTWLMVGLALGMLAIIFITGKPEAPARRTPAAPAASQAASADRVRDYQDRLRALEALAAQDDPAATAPLGTAPTTAPSSQAAPPTAPGGGRPEDPIAADKKRRNYESLFAGNVVLSRRPSTERPEPSLPMAAPSKGSETPPSIDDIADAAFRATQRAQAALPPAPPQPTAGRTDPQTSALAKASTSASTSTTTRPTHTEAISDAGPLHRILEGTLIDAVLTNRLESSGVAPVNCLVTDPLYSHRGRVVLIPAGARLLGETRPVQAFGETRLAVAFHRLLLPDGSTYSLNQFLGLNQLGDAGLRDRVNQHYLSSFGAAAAIGLISGLSQYLGSAGLGQGGDRTVVIAGGATDATAQAGLQIMNRFLNRMPTITIREGHRVRIYITNDIDLPAYPAGSGIR